MTRHFRARPARTPCGGLRALVALAAAAAMLGHFTPAAAQTKPPLKLGAVLSLTGGLAVVGYSTGIGVRMAVAEVNQSGGILGRQVQIVQGDDGTDVTLAVNEAKRLVQQEKVEIMVGPLFTPAALAAANALVPTNPNIVFWSLGTSIELNTKGGPTLFSAGPSSDTLAESMFAYATEVRHAKVIALLSDESLQAVAISERIRAAAKRSGMTLAADDQFKAGSTDMTPQVLNLRRVNPELILLSNFAPADVGYFLKNMDEVGFNVPVVGVNGVVVNYPAVAKVAGPKAVKNLVGGPAAVTFLYCKNDPVGQSDYAKFLVRLKGFQPDLDANASVTQVAEIYDFVMLSKAAAEAVGSTDGAKMTAWLESNPPSVHPVSTELHLTKTDHFLLSAQSVAMAEDLGNIRSDGLYKRGGC
jgi:ABC-type branched-subunit amino acid transport system substrate-binding protein